MTPVLRQFLAEGREFLQSISENVMQLEAAPSDAALMGELFRSVHTLKGNSGLFDFPEMSRVLHAAEDLMSAVRDGQLDYSQALADRLLDAMDFVGMLFDGVEVDASSGARHGATSVTLAAALRELIGARSTAAPDALGTPPAHGPGGADTPSGSGPSGAGQSLSDVPQALRAAWHGRPGDHPPLLWITYIPESECFYKGEDPFHQARQLPGIEWQRLTTASPWPALADFDPYHCVLRFEMVSSASREQVEEHFRYVPEQVQITPIHRGVLAASLGAAQPRGGGSQSLNELAKSVIEAQSAVLRMPMAGLVLPGRIRAAAATLAACCQSAGRSELVPSLEAALQASLSADRAEPLLAWLEKHREAIPGDSPAAPAASPVSTPPASAAAQSFAQPAEATQRRRSEDASASRNTLKVDQEKIDRLMSLIGEMVVAKNALPFLASRAETVHASRDMSREIKAQYTVINRIAEEMQDVIMQVRMTPVSTVFQRFPRLVRDISRKLEKQVSLVLEGEDTEADKNVIEALADPLIHIVRNSLDHGIELPAVRVAAGKPAEGRLVIRASQEADRVTIDISDDGKGIDPAVVKQKALEKGIIDHAMSIQISDRDAVNLVFAPGFSTVERVSDLSGRGVGMDVVRTAVEQINGSVTLDSVVGSGTRLRLSLPLSMAVTNVMIVESNRQIFGVPMDVILETVRFPRSDVRSLKNRQTTVLRDRVMPLRSLNELLAANEPQIANDADEIAALVVQIQGETVGIVVDRFREVADIILKPMTGILGGLPAYAGSALLGDGSVLMVLNPKELVSWA